MQITKALLAKVWKKESANLAIGDVADAVKAIRQELIADLRRCGGMGRF